MRVSCEGLYRARARVVSFAGGHFSAVCDPIEPIHGDPVLEEAYFRTAKALAEEALSDNQTAKELITKLSNKSAKAYKKLEELKSAEKLATSQEGYEAKAEVYESRVLPTMSELRAVIDSLETITSSEYWPLPTYGELMFCV